MLASRLRVVVGPLLRGNFCSAAKTAQTDKVLYHRKNPFVLEAILNKEKALNALDSDMIMSLTTNVEQWNKDPTLRVVVMRGTGKKAFCAGGDIKTLYDARVAEKNPNVRPDVLDSFFRGEFTADFKIASMKPLQVALWDGIVMGGGVGVSIHAPFRIATENSHFAMPEAKIGLFTDVAGGYFLSRLKDHLGLYLGLTSASLKGKDLVRAGIANYYIPSERVEELTKRLYENPFLTQSIAYQTSDTRAENPKPEALSKVGIAETISSLAEPVEGEIANAAAIKRNLEDLFAILAQEQSDSPWAAETLKTLQRNSPLSLRVIWEQIRRAKSQDLKEALKSDFRTMHSLGLSRFMGESEFFEGVRCLLVDRKDTPKWKYAQTKDITDAEVSKYFEPLEDSSKELVL